MPISVLRRYFFQSHCSATEKIPVPNPKSLIPKSNPTVVRLRQDHIGTLHACGHTFNPTVVRLRL
ncbi:MAG: hypothetical protein RMK94_17485, partial [Armatimonadota bacterium]|nr:hypothetical protein [Armatimonadota bacterium]